jgi:succinate dehydrogenase (ubiquinone) iron-sulfur subunit
MLMCTDQYLGPAVLMQAYRWMADSRVSILRRRIRRLNPAGPVRLATQGEDAEHHVPLPMPHHLQRESCAAVYIAFLTSQCSRTCPKGLNPAMAISKMKLEMATDS